ncbi:MAG: hypothetical protein S4CHLAM123_14400 [Chlamydiales bacterium]|nr:hypothetical protein [Chlamydiales bacterium]
MLVGIWLIVLISIIFIIITICNEYDKYRFLNLLINKNDIEYIANEWLLSFAKRIEKKNIAKHFLSPEGHLVRSRIWTAWKSQTEAIRVNIKTAKIYFGANIQTPIEEAFPRADLYIQSQGTIEAEIAFWKIENALSIDFAAIRDCYSENDFKLFIASINEESKNEKRGY